MKKLYTLTLLMLLSVVTFAATIDSTFLKNFHLGVGVTTGVQQLKYYKTYSSELKYTRGFEVGALANLQYKFWKHNTLLFDFRLMQSNAVHKFSGQLVEHTFSKQQITLSYSRGVNYKKKNLFNLSAGLAYHFSNEELFYQVDPTRYPPYPQRSTVPFMVVSEKFYKEYTSLVLGVSKSYKLKNRFTYNTFIEFDYGLDKIDWDSEANRSFVFFLSEIYRPLSLRLGLTVVY